MDELTDSEIQMYLDGQLKGIRKSDLENRIAAEPAIRSRIIEYTTLDKKFSQRYGTSIFVKQEQGKKNRQAMFVNWRMASSFAMGLLAAVIVMNIYSGNKQVNYAQEAIVAHFKYSPEQHLANNVQTLTFDKVNKNDTFTPPDLIKAGLELVGIRHLRMDEGKSVQLMYHDKLGERYTVIITRNPTKTAPQQPDYYNTQLAQVSYWGKNNYNFAITGVKEGLDVRTLQPMIAANF